MVKQEHHTIEKRLERLLLQRHFDEAIVLMFCALTVLFITPFVAFRLFTGEWLHAAINALATLAILANGIYVSRTRRTEIAAPLLAALFTSTLLTVVYLFDTDMLMWTYPVTTAMFFVLKPRNAIRLNLLILAVLTPRVIEFIDGSGIVTFYITLLGTNVLALTFAAGMRLSRSRLSVMAERDALTGARNRHSLEPMLDAALEKQRQQETPASLMVIDLDRFKEINDQFGHDVGDRALKEIVEILTHATRTGDDVFRYGGEELVVLANGAESGPAGRLAEKLRRRIRRTPLDTVGPLSVSIGVAEARAGDTPESWFRRADALMYRAKEEGRNRVVVEPVANGTESERE